MEAFDQEILHQASVRPRVRFLCGRDLIRGPFDYVIGVAWDRDFDAQPGEYAYKKWFTIVLKFRLWIDRSYN